MKEFLHPYSSFSLSLFEGEQEILDILREKLIQLTRGALFLNDGTSLFIHMGSYRKDDYVLIKLYDLFKREVVSISVTDDNYEVKGNIFTVNGEVYNV